MTLKTNPLSKQLLQDFIESYKPDNRDAREETERFKSFDYDTIISRDKANLDIFWLKDDSLEDSDSLPSPDVLAAEIAENLEAALEQFSSIYLGRPSDRRDTIDPRVQFDSRQP